MINDCGLPAIESVIYRDILCGIVDTKDKLGSNSEVINHFSDYTLNSLHIILENMLVHFGIVSV